ncbi:MAG: hypothetical protein FJ297_00335 [Planctomycetes bacterium]|nr:hypothetical protein [Planctomycetota bacterium]
MSRRELANLTERKNQLADRYVSLARSRKSKPARERLLRKADGYRREAKDLANKLARKGTA